MHNMKGISKTDIRSVSLISLSYFIFWWIIVFVSSSGQVTYFFKAASIYSWKIIFVTLLNLYLHLLAIPFARKRILKWVWIILIIVSLLILLTLGFNFWNHFGSLLSVLPVQKNEPFDIDSAVKNLLFQLFGIAYFASIKFFIDSFNLKLKNKELDIEKKTSELNYLKSQTNPHFLFNTLNNIYTLSREKSDLAPESFLRLSGILRYMLY